MSLVPYLAVPCIYHVRLYVRIHIMYHQITILQNASRLRLTYNETVLVHRCDVSTEISYRVRVLQIDFRDKSYRY